MTGTEGLRALKKAIGKRHGKGTMGIALKMRTQKIPRLSTGSMIADYAFGACIMQPGDRLMGGVPYGRVTMLYGSEQSGKSTMSYRVAGISQGLCAHCLRPANDLEVVQVSEEKLDPKNGEILEEEEYEARATCDCYEAGIYQPEQREGENAKDYKLRLADLSENSYAEFRVALIDVEGAFEPDWGLTLGIDLRRMLHVIPDTAEEAIDIYDGVLRTGSVHLVILDSIAAMIPSEELEKSSEDTLVALQARLVGRMTRKVQSSINTVTREFGHSPTQIWINQQREKINVSWGDKNTISGGNAQKFACSLMAKMWSSKWEKSVIDKELKQAFQIERGESVSVNFKVTKNKTAPSHASACFPMFISGPRKGQIDEFGYVVAQAEKFGILRQAENKKSWFLGDEEHKKKASILKRLEDEDVFGALRQSVLRRMVVADMEGTNGEA